MAHRLNLNVVAECVETAEQLQFLQAHGCDQAQGYYFAKPMPVAELEALWEQSKGYIPQVAINPVEGIENEVFASAWPEWQELQAALLAGSRSDTTAIVERRLAQGAGCGPVEVARHLIQPALYQTGKMWLSRQISVAQGHLTTMLALSVMAQALSRSALPNPGGKKVLLACVEGNHHSVGLQMVSDAFTLAGWDVRLLGADTPEESLIEYVQEWKPDLLGLSAALPQHVRALGKSIARMRQSLGSGCPPIIVGGLGLNASPHAAEALENATGITHPAAAVSAGEGLCRQAGSKRPVGRRGAQLAAGNLLTWAEAS